MSHRSSAQISPTAHYTGYVWTRSGLSHPAFVTWQGRALHAALRPINALSAATGGPTVDGFLLARHRRIDALLTEAIEDGRVSQVVEVAAGLSPRGWRFRERYGDRITYIEADLPAMAERKRRVLADLGSIGPGHRVVELDATAADGPESLAVLAQTVDTRQGTALVTEGLLNYFDEAAVRGMWLRFAAFLGSFPIGVYLSDLHLAEDTRGASARAFRQALSLFVGSPVHLHFATAATAEEALRAAGFSVATVARADGGVVAVIHAHA